MVNPNFLKLKEYLTIDEAGQHIAHHLKKKTAGNSEILFLINEGLVNCFLDCSLDPVIGVLDTEHVLDGLLYQGIANGLQKIINPNVKFYYKESSDYTGNIYYTDSPFDLIGDFYSLNECIPCGEKKCIERFFNQVTHHSYGEVEESDGSKGRYFKVETTELVNTLERLNPEDFTSPHDVAQLQSPSQPNSLLADELLQAKEEITRLKAQLLEMRATNSTFVIAGALIEMLTEQKTPRRNQTKIKLELEEKGLKGLSKSSLDNLFVDANKALKASKGAG